MERYVENVYGDIAIFLFISGFFLAVGSIFFRHIVEIIAIGQLAGYFGPTANPIEMLSGLFTCYWYRGEVRCWPTLKFFIFPGIIFLGSMVFF